MSEEERRLRKALCSKCRAYARRLREEGAPFGNDMRDTLVAYLKVLLEGVEIGMRMQLETALSAVAEYSSTKKTALEVGNE